MTDLATAPIFMRRAVDTEAARRWVDELNIDNNRKVKPSHVQAMARDMQLGRFHGLNGETLKFNDEQVRYDETLMCTVGRLIDGQNRLRAVIASGCTVDFIVAVGVPQESFNTIDSGVPRGVSDLLTFDGFSNANQLAAIVKKAILWDRGQRFVSGNGGAKVTKAEIVDYLATDPEAMRTATEWAVTARRRVALRPASLGLVHVLFNRIDQSDAEEFLTGLESGVGLSVESPIYLLRDRLTRDSRLTHGEGLALTIRAWNAYRRKELPGRLIISRGTLTPENFPKPA